MGVATQPGYGAVVCGQRHVDRVTGSYDRRMAGSRPGVLRWLAYAYGKRLPPRYAQWVLHDLTCRTWFARVLARGAAQSLPGLVLLALPASPAVVAMMLAIVVFGMVFYSMAFAWEIRDRRLYQHGFVPELVLPREKDDDAQDDTQDGADEDPDGEK